MPYAKEINDDTLEVYSGGPMGLPYYAEHGYTLWTDEEIAAWHEKHKPPFDPMAHKYNPYSVMEELMTIGKWEEVKAMIVAAGMWERYEATPYLSFTNRHFAAFYEALKSQLPEIDVLLEKCIFEL